MQRVGRAVERAGGGTASVRRTRRSAPFSTYGTAAATRVATLAPTCLQSLPSLMAIPLEYSHEEGAKLLYELCAALVREGLGTPEDWSESGKNCIVFVQRAVMRAIGEDRWNLLRRNVELHLTISDTIEKIGIDEPLGAGRLAVTIECSGCGFLKLGPAIETLEAEAKGLGAAFYSALLQACYRVMRVYDHEDALQYEEGMRQMAEGEEDAEQQYEFPEVEKALPECIRLLRQKNHGRQTERARGILRSKAKGRYKSWLDRLRRLQRLARVRVRGQRESLMDSNYDSPPLPSVLVAFRERDAITACFDEEGQHMLEGSCEPAATVCFDPTNLQELREAVRVVSRFVLFNHELFQLAEELAQWEKDHGSTRLDREDP
jgi:hypothetical protein